MTNNSKNNDNPQVLLIEDSMSHALIYLSYLDKSALTACHVGTGGAGLMHIKAHTPELVLLDLELPDIPGMSILKYISDNQLPCQVIIITGHGSIDIAVEAMQAGAFDFLTKPFDARRFNSTVKNALAMQHLNKTPTNQTADSERQQYQSFIGGSQAMQQVYQMIDNVAMSKASVFICGESGTGKELCAEALHQKSSRSNLPFVALNCASIPKELMESEFFGHVKGAFTGAFSDRTGAVEQADGGTLFLDEICEMDLELQSKLLRFIQTGIYRKVGSSKERKVDVRFVCATNRSPLEEVAKGNFREDLYYRLHVIPINLPPLRDRDGDGVLIANHLLKHYAAEENKAIKGFSEDAEAILRTYQWPGNVRQMQNIIRLIAVLNNVEWITPELLPAPLNVVKASAEALASQAKAVTKPQSDTAIEVPFQEPERELAQNLLSVGSVSDLSTVSEVLAVAVDNSAVKADKFNSQSEAAFSSKEEIEPFGVYEKRIIEAAISSCDGNVPEAAAQLALSPSTLYRKIQSWKTDKR